MHVLFSLSLWGLLNIIGTIALLKVAGEFSAVTAVLTAFIRKFSSLIFSYFLYPKPFNLGHCMGLVLVFASVGMHAYHKQHKKPAAQSAASDKHDGGAGLGVKMHATSVSADKGTDEEMGTLLQSEYTQCGNSNQTWAGGFAQGPPASPHRGTPGPTHRSPPSPLLRPGSVPARHGA